MPEASPRHARPSGRAIIIGVVGYAVAVLVILLSLACSKGVSRSNVPDTGEGRWQSSWETFLGTLAQHEPLPETSFPSMFPASEKFIGQVVTWEGTLDSVKDAKTRVRMQMATSRAMRAASGKVVKADSVQLEMKAGTFAKWKGLTQGTKVKFRATVPELFYMVVTVGGVDGPPHIFICLDNAESL